VIPNLSLCPGNDLEYQEYWTYSEVCVMTVICIEEPTLIYSRDKLTQSYCLPICSHIFHWIGAT
jgi:hypothetical protein